MHFKLDYTKCLTFEKIVQVQSNVFGNKPPRLVKSILLHKKYNIIVRVSTVELIWHDFILWNVSTEFRKNISFRIDKRFSKFLNERNYLILWSLSSCYKTYSINHLIVLYVRTFFYIFLLFFLPNVIHRKNLEKYIYFRYFKFVVC